MTQYKISSTSWLQTLLNSRPQIEISQIKKAISLYETHQDEESLQQSLCTADILLQMGLDNETLVLVFYIAAIRKKILPLDQMAKEVQENGYRILCNVMKLQSLENLQRHTLKRGHSQVEKLRKLLLSMVSDVRVVLIVLAERLCALRQAKDFTKEIQLRLAHETLNIYAPLANRLGIWQLKWEMEDFCLRYLNPTIYKTIAKGIAEKRTTREKYIQYFKNSLIELLHEAKIHNVEVTGRVKHIYSIYKKMQRKNANLAEIYDMIALRVLTDNIHDCYNILSVLQAHFAHVPKEFDDYIAHPKPNGYQSIHTVLISEDKHFVEVQIRTYEMHQASELGVAAHWRYKEGILNTDSYEAKIALLRQVMAWQQDVSYTKEIEAQSIDIFADRVYVFTPNGDIIELQRGATPIDFAYTIHSEVGHRCRGAKINGAIVPLTYELQTGERVEILTAKHSQPSRDWLSNHIKYVQSQRTRSKILQWFRSKEETKEILKEADKPKIQPVKASELTPKTPYLSQPAVHVMGMDKLLSHIARCCKPLPGDAVIGYITRNRGVSIHRALCGNAKQIQVLHPERIMEIAWGKQKIEAYAGDLTIRAIDRSALLKDITSLLANEKIEILALRTQKNMNQDEVDIFITLRVSDRIQLDKAVTDIHKLPQVLDVKRAR